MIIYIVNNIITYCDNIKIIKSASRYIHAAKLTTLSIFSKAFKEYFF